MGDQSKRQNNNDRITGWAAAPDLEWELVPSRSQAGDRCEIRVIDREGGPGGRTVCVITGNLLYRVADGQFDRLLDEDDIANARLIVAAPALRRIVADLVNRAKEAGLHPEVWREAQDLLAKIARPRD